MYVRSGGWPWRRLLTAALAALAIFAYWTHVADRGAREAARGPMSAEARDPATAQPWGSSVGFADQRRLDEHYAKHGAEFGRITKQDYLRQAQLLRDTKPVDPVLEAVRRDGVITRYDRQTGAFIAFNPNGVIRTFFKPNDGERYWRRQAERGE
jgi:pyocin large subunit-like protein